MADWFYADGDERRGPFDGHELRERFARGELPPTTLVWNESLPDWVAASTLPFFAPPEGSAPPPLESSQGYAEHYAPVGTAPFGYAGFWKRFVSAFIDGFVLLIPNFMISAAMAAIQFASGPEPDVGVIVLAQTLGLFLAAGMQWLYFALFESSGYQATPGKMALGIRVTDLDGNRLSFLRATGRYFGKILSFMTLGIGYIMAAFTSKKQALHDMMAGCLVVNKR